MAIQKFIENLKQKHITHYKCNSCGYSQGHQIIYCPKCPNKMKLIKETEYESFIDYEEAKNNLYYKGIYEKIVKKYVSFSEWNEVVEFIKRVGVCERVIQRHKEASP